MTRWRRGSASGGSGGRSGCRRGGPARGSRAPRRFAVWALAVVMAAALTGCASVRNELGTVNSDCYIALPAAFRAVHHHGKLDGVRLVSVASLRTKSPLLYDAAVAKGRVKKNVCLVAFVGNFLAASVTGPIGDTAGHVAVVELGYPDKHLIATLVLRRPPLPFGHFRV